MKEKLSKKELIKIILIILSTILVSITFYYIGDLFEYRAYLLNPGFIDDIIHENNHFVYFYISWYPLLFIVPFVFALKDDKHFKKYINSVFICLIISLIIFIVFPTIMLREEYLINTLSDKILFALQKISTPTKCIPSLHVALATLFICSCITNKNINKYYKIIVIFFSIGIIFSTMAVKQHYFVDVISGVIVAVVSWLLSNFIYNLRQRKVIDKEA